jgi:hypothetical protein
LSLYWLLVVPAGIAGIFMAMRRSRGHAGLLALLTAATVLPLVLIYFAPDLRYRTVADLLLGCFAAYVYAELARHRTASLSPSSALSCSRAASATNL